MKPGDAGTWNGNEVLAKGEKPKLIRTKFGGKCIFCTGGIPAGSPCRWYPDRGVAHEDGDEKCAKLVEFGNRTAGAIFAESLSPGYMDEFTEDYQNAFAPER